MHSWISVKDGKPEGGKRYLIADGLYVYPEMAFWASLGKVFIGWLSKERHPVTHYRPYPERRKENGNA